jgi:hypothetical protein
MKGPDFHVRAGGSSAMEIEDGNWLCPSGRTA